MPLVASSGAVVAPFSVISPFGSPRLPFVAPQFLRSGFPLPVVLLPEVGAELGVGAGTEVGAEVGAGVGVEVGTEAGAEVGIVAGFLRLESPVFVWKLFLVFPLPNLLAVLPPSRSF